MLFYGVRGFKMRNMTFKDPVHYGATFDRLSYFTFENIVFDYNHSNPNTFNMDGLHFNGNCHFGQIRNLQGACHDDLVALNAHEGSKGPITNIEIDGIFAEDCHSAVRLLTVSDDIENIHISNIYGTYYQYCIALTKYYPGETTGYYKNITLDNIYASKAERYALYGREPASTVFAVIDVLNGTKVKNLTIKNLHRTEYKVSVETIRVSKGAEVEHLILHNITSESHVDAWMPLVGCYGKVARLDTSELYTDGDAVLANAGGGAVNG